MGDLTLVSIKMSTSPGSARPPTLGLNIVRCITSRTLVNSLLRLVLSARNPKRKESYSNFPPSMRAHHLLFPRGPL